MLRNIPGRYSQQSLLAEIRQAGYEPDFFYLPMDFSREANSGYCFLNLEPEAVPRFRRRFDGQRLAHRSGKVLQVVPALTQGYEANYEKFAHSAVLNHHKAEHQPLFMREGEEGRPRGKNRPAPSAGSGLYVLRELPKVYTEEMVWMELVHHGCADSVVSLQVPLDDSGLNLGYALVRFAPHRAGPCRRALHGECFHLAPAALAMRLDEVHVHGQPQQVPLAPLAPLAAPEAPLALTPVAAPLSPVCPTPLSADAPEFVPRQPQVPPATFAPFSFADQLTDSDSAFEPAAPVTPEKPKTNTTTAWERYAELLATVPQDQWSGELLLAHFGQEELKEMQQVALATLRESRTDLGKFADLGIDLDDEAQDEAGAELQVQPLQLWPEDAGVNDTPQYNVAWRGHADSMSPSADTPVLKAQALIRTVRPSGTPPTRSQSSGSSRSASPCGEAPACDLAKVPHTPFNLARPPHPASPTDKRVRFNEQVKTLPFHTDAAPALSSARLMLPSPPPSGP